MAGVERDIAGRRYALAILDIARADGDIDAWLEAGDALESLTQQASFVEALQADGLTDEKFIQIVRQVLPAITEKQLNTFRLLRRKGRLALGPSINSYLKELVDEERGRVRAVVTTAIELEPDRLQQVRQRISQTTGHDVEVEPQVDPHILGGMMVRIGDQLIDGSVRTRLQRLRSRLEQAAV